MDHTNWGTAPQGIAGGGNGLVMSARDAAKFGQLFLQNGQWKGEQIVSADWVELSPGAYGPQSSYASRAYLTDYALKALTED